MRLGPDDAHFLEAVRTAPDDDEPRLVYADLLQQRGSPWGELIVVQCAIARHQKSGDTMSDAYAALLRTERAVIGTRDEWWESELGYPDVLSFSRGFPSDVTFASATELTTAHSWLRHFPALDTIRVELREGEVLRLYTVDYLPARGLMLVPQAKPAPGYMFDFLDAGVLTTWLAKVAPSLASFSVAGDIEERALGKLLESPTLRSIKRLAVTDAGLRNLFSFLNGCLSRPEELILDANPLSYIDVSAFPAVSELRHLSVHNSRVGMGTIATLLANSTHMRSLVAGGARIEGGLGMLMTASALDRLERLDMSGYVEFALGDFLAPEPLAVLAARFTELIDFDIGGNAITDESVRALMSRAPPKLRRIGLSKNADIGPASVEAIVDRGVGMETLGLWRTQVGDRGAEIIASSPIFSGLRTLELSSAGLTEKGARALARSSILPSVLRLEVSASEVGDALQDLRERFAIVVA